MGCQAQESQHQGGGASKPPSLSQPVTASLGPALRVKDNLEDQSDSRTALDTMISRRGHCTVKAVRRRLARPEGGTSWTFPGSSGTLRKLPDGLLA